MKNIPKISLINNQGNSWFSNQGVTIKGYFFDSKSTLYQNEKTILFFKEIKNQNDFVSKLKEINGLFTVIIQLGDYTYIASDTSRIFPVFYSTQNGQVIISDSVEQIRIKYNLNKFNIKSETEFLSSGYTMGSKTLIDNIFQIQSNQYLIFNKNKLETKEFFFSYSIKQPYHENYIQLKDKTVVSFENTFKRLEQSLSNRQAVIPLSGGYDSRLIAVMLKKRNYKNIVCYTYGKKGNKEIEISKRVANELDIKWYFIEYTDKLISNFTDSKLFKEYVNFTGNYSSMPFLQEYFSVKYLKENQLIDTDAIFIPGHSGDLLGGSQIIKEIPLNITTDKIATILLTTKHKLHPLCLKEREIIKKNIQKTIFDFDENFENKLAYSVFEDFDIKEKISKLIMNSSNVYNFFGYEQRFPFWDKELLNHFKKTPIKYKINKKLYDDVLINNYFVNLNINFTKELQPTLNKILIQKLKNHIKPLLPKIFLDYKLKKNDLLNYNSMINQVEATINRNNLQKKTKIYQHNERLIEWYLYFAKNIIK